LLVVSEEGLQRCQRILGSLVDGHGRQRRGDEPALGFAVRLASQVDARMIAQPDVELLGCDEELSRREHRPVRIAAR
jgi:hypothetical protein